MRIPLQAEIVANRYVPKLENLAKPQAKIRTDMVEIGIVRRPSVNVSQEIQGQFAQKFALYAADAKAFHQMMKEAFGDGYDASVAETFRQRALAGDSSWLPPIVFVNEKALAGGYGAFDSTSNVVYISDRFLSNPGAAAKVYTEEVGHFLDTKVNRQDTQGDEGEIFRRMIFGEHLDKATLCAVRAEDDHGTIEINGKQVQVEFWNPFKAAGKAIKKGVGAAVGASKAVGKFVGSAAVNVFTRIHNGVKTFAGGIVQAARGMVANVLEGGGNLLRGLIKIGTGHFKSGIKDVFSGLFKATVQNVFDNIVLMTMARAMSAIQTMVGLEPVGRKLSPEERDQLRKVFGDSIDYDAVTIKEGNAGLFGLSGKPFTHGNVIYIPKKRLNADGHVPMSLLIHEMVHVWQNQNGGTDYMSEALWARRFGDGYDWRKALAQGKAWDQLNPEQQAALIESAYNANYFSEANPLDNTGMFYDYMSGTPIDYTEALQAALRTLILGQGAP